MPSSELLICKECGQSFDTVESLKEHMKSEKDEIKNRIKGFSDG
ncbi:MAG TPA: C2H2-type zinc finger protein [Nitrososphaera sp.]|nr:C2H2-type zinc finger protein [Nitrososphaera sp.]